MRESGSVFRGRCKHNCELFKVELRQRLEPPETHYTQQIVPKKERLKVHIKKPILKKQGKEKYVRNL